MQVLGCRGMGAAKSTLMSLVGLGSVSSYCLHYLDCPVCLVRGTGLTGPRKTSNKVLVAVDDSDLAKRAQRWAIDNVLGPHDELHLVSVATPVPYVVSGPYAEQLRFACAAASELRKVAAGRYRLWAAAAGCFACVHGCALTVGALAPWAGGRAVACGLQLRPCG